MKKFPVLVIFLFLATVGVTAQGLDLNFGIGANTSLASVRNLADGLSKAADASSDLDSEDSGTAGQAVIDVRDGLDKAEKATNKIKADTRFHGYVQVGYNFNSILSAGLEGGVAFNYFNDMFTDASSIILEFPIHIYGGVTLFDVIKLTAYTGVTFPYIPNLDELSLPDDYDAITYDIGARALFGLFFLEFSGAINLNRPSELTDMRVGLGLEFDFL